MKNRINNWLNSRNNFFSILGEENVTNKDVIATHVVASLMLVTIAVTSYIFN